MDEIEGELGTPSGRVSVEKAVQREVVRRKRLLVIYVSLLIVPFMIGVGFLIYGRVDRLLVGEKLNDEVSPIKNRLASSEKTSSELQREIIAANIKLSANQAQIEQVRISTSVSRKEIAAIHSSNVPAKENASVEDVGMAESAIQVVRTDLDATKTDLNDTKNNLQMARSELGTLIAKNHDEVEELRKLGERDYIEFAIEGKNTERKVGLVSIQLRDVREEKNQFTISVVLFGKRLELENRSVDEVLYLHSAAPLRPIELTITQVTRDRIVGYLGMTRSLSQTPSQK